MCKLWMLLVAGIALAGLPLSTIPCSAAPIGPSALVGAAGQALSSARMTIGRPRALEKKRRIKHERMRQERKQRY
ncbi:UNVERIFIED_CONTAM: hypothetical protein Q9R58_23595 [Methylobacteriaceae bacterium AG10]|uniref:Uncharacterized protein n=1 Tax=Methylorubrum podarium TaxID=200476 RepID=A0ABV1QT05_9HYPH|nr:hypothetical protein [Methylobacteriaceae bacterium AG10]